jgi:hypothetical protein
VNLVEVDALHAEPLEAGFGFAADGRGLQIVRNLAVLVPDKTALVKT